MAAARPAPPAKPPPAKVPPTAPNQTLYVCNLPSAHIQKSDLQTALYMLFSTYGPVLDVVTLKTMKMRGQAHVVFRDLQAATQAMRSLDGMPFLGLNLIIHYAKTKSDVVAKLDGTYKMPGSAAANVEMNETQNSIFNAPVPGTAAAAKSSAPSLSGLPPKPQASASPAAPAPTSTSAAEAAQRGQKRNRDEEDGEEEEDESDEDVAMDEDSDDE